MMWLILYLLLALVVFNYLAGRGSHEFLTGTLEVEWVPKFYEHPATKAQLHTNLCLYAFLGVFGILLMIGKIAYAILLAVDERAGKAYRAIQNYKNLPKD